MKKTIAIFILIIIVLTNLSACSKKEDSFPANGVLIIGDENYSFPILDRYKENTNKKEVFSVKTGKFGKGKVLIIDESTAQSMIKAKVFRKRDVNKGLDSIPMDTLPNIPKEGSLLFTHEDEERMKNIELGGKMVPVIYDSNAWIGNTRDYRTQWYVVVAKNNVYKEIKANETKLQLLHLKKSLGDEKPKMSTDNTLTNEYLKMKKQNKDFDQLLSVQFVKIEEKS
ncbi:hypothetical protein D0U04_22270 [Bacillus clarus]|uniref:Lipoprotein n=1 Tax=Bacillus clarus TaxID=2338372 RepID=A0A090YZZ7_9BACI|nr:lipoprotein BA_5634 family protein [Bacillus clarus]KFN03673.1 hypothetical protein DJ93_5120 [Bacillus clarus]RFT64399.1 hypothetical protein D0U04_22270 [Bacillus clarus]